MKAARLAPLAALAALAAAGAARGAEVQVDPVLLELSPGTRSVTVTLRNAGTAPARFEVTARAWAQTPAGEMQVSPTDELLVYPPLLSLEPGASRLIRVGVAPKATFGAAERAFRVFIEELPPPRKPGDPAQVQVTTRLSLPAFLAPARAVERAVVGAPAVSGGAARFALRNEGTVRFRAGRVQVATLAADGARLGALELQGWYVLAGTERAFEVQLPQERCAEARAVEVTAELEKGPSRARSPTPGGVCAR